MREICDPSLSAEVRRYGVFNEHGCFACGSCTLVCDLSDGFATFPRRPMQAVVLGLKDSVAQTLDPWICHDCGDCSATCPRDAAPRQSMMTLRRYLTAQYDWTGLASQILRSRKSELAALGTVALLVLVLIILYHLTIERLDITVFRSTAMGLEHMFPRILYFTWAVFLIPAFFVVSNVWRMHRLTMRGAGKRIPLRHYASEAKALLLGTFVQSEILNCAAKDRKMKWTVHWFMALGCVVLVAIKFFFLRWFQTDKIFPPYHPQRWLGYLAAAFLIAGAVDLLAVRLRERDATLPALLLLTGVSGIAVHIFRYAGLTLASHYAYAVHLMIATPMLVIEVPFGYWSHMIYRPLALYFSAVQARAAGEQRTTEEVAA